MGASEGGHTPPVTGWCGKVALALALGVLTFGCQTDPRTPVVAERDRAPRAAGSGQGTSSLARALQRVAADCRYTSAGVVLLRGCRPATLELELAALERSAVPGRLVADYGTLIAAGGSTLPLLASARLAGLAQEHAWARRAATPAALAALSALLQRPPPSAALGERVAHVLGLLAGAARADAAALGRLLAGAPPWATAAVYGGLWTHGRTALWPPLSAALVAREESALRIAALRGLAGGPPWGAEECARVCPLIEALTASDESLAIAAEAGLRAASACPGAQEALLVAGRRWVLRGEFDDRLIRALAVAAARPAATGPQATDQAVAALLAAIVRQPALSETTRATALVALAALELPLARRVARAVVRRRTGPLARVAGEVLARRLPAPPAALVRAAAPAAARRAPGE